LIGEYCKIFKASDRNCPVEVIPPRTERQDDDFLLDELNGTQSNESADSCEMPSQQGSAISSISNISCSENLVDIPTLTMDRLDISTPSFVIDKSERCFDDRSFIKEKEPLGQIHNNPDNRKKKKLKIPEKYETIVEDLRCDRSDCIDLTNA
jgi:chemotaxis protein CheY-P-specific phosphatase CheC